MPQVSHGFQVLLVQASQVFRRKLRVHPVTLTKDSSSRMVSLSTSKSTRDMINRLHHANSSFQSTQPIFLHLLEYQHASKLLLPLEPLLKKLQEDKSFANRHAWLGKATATLRRLTDEIVRYCVFNIDEPGPCGETPVRIAFLLGLSDLGNNVWKSFFGRSYLQSFNKVF